MHKIIFSVKYDLSISHTSVVIYILYNSCRPALKWLGQPVAEPKVPGSNPGQGTDVKTVRPRPHQWLCSETGRRKVPGLFLGRASRPSRSEFFVVFLLKSRKYGLGSLRNLPTSHQERYCCYRPKSHNRKIDLTPTTQPNLTILNRHFQMTLL